MSDAKRVLLVGATGLVGRKVIAHGRAIEGVSLLALARRELQLPRGGRMQLVLAPVEDWARTIALLAPDAIICALGTTQAKSGKQGLLKVDRDLVLDIANSASKVGTARFVHISSIGADAASRSHYLAAKGQAEQGLRKIGFRRLDILRPGLLRGKRYDDRRPAEAVGQMFRPLTDLALQGGWRRYRSIDADRVALAALQAIREQQRGTFVHEHDNLLKLASRLPR